MMKEIDDSKKDCKIEIKTKRVLEVLVNKLVSKHILEITNLKKKKYKEAEQKSVLQKFY